MGQDYENDPLARFYAATAAGYDAACRRQGERAHDLALLRPRVAELVRGHRVLELACGSGYWTEVLAQNAAQVLATDVVEPMLELARGRGLAPERVSWRRIDARRLPDDLGGFDCVFAAGWWSHLTRDEQDALLSQLRARVGKDVLLVLVDDVHVEGDSLPVARTDAQGNTYQRVTGPDGVQVELPKNYPSDSALRKRLASAGREIRIERLAHYWLLTCRLK